MSNGLTKSLKEKFSRLQVLSNEAGPALFERIKIASEIMSDTGYIEARYANDEEACSEELGRKYFLDLAGLMSVWQLVEVFRAFPNEEIWKEDSYNLKVLRDRYLANREKPTGGGRRSAKIEDIKERDEKIEELKYNIKRFEETSKREEKEITRLKEENIKLREENALLRGRIGELERMMNRLHPELVGTN